MKGQNGIVNIISETRRLRVVLNILLRKIFVKMYYKFLGFMIQKASEYFKPSGGLPSVSSAKGEVGVNSSHPSHNSICGFHFMHARGEMKVDAASHSISQHHAIAGKPKCEENKQDTELHRPGPSAVEQPQGSQSSSKTHVCDVCGKGFVLRSNLKQHLLVHTGIKPHVCSECGKRFTQLSNLKTHSIVHTGEKPHVCGVCGKAYTSLHNLKAHEYIHTGERKRHVCETCGQGFYQHGDLKTHKLIHTGQKPHVCGICGKGFIKRGDLNVHMVVHTGEKPHACELCGKRFAQRWKLMKHSMVHTKKLDKIGIGKDIIK